MCIRDSAHRAVCLPAARFRSGRHALLLVGGEFLWRGGLRPPCLLYTSAPGPVPVQDPEGPEAPVQRVEEADGGVR